MIEKKRMLLLLISLVCGLLACHILEGESSGALVVATTTVASTLLSSVVDLVRGALAAVVGVPLFVVGHFVWVSRLLGVVLLSWLIHEFPVAVLSVCDNFFRRVLNPAVSFAESLCFLVRLGYEPVVVFYNMVTSVLRSVVTGSVFLVSKCSVDLVVSVVTGSLEVVILFFKSFFKWLSGDAGGSGGLLKNQFDFQPVFEGVQVLLSNSVELTGCVCEELSNGVRVFVAFVTPPALARATNHFWNVPIVAAQEIFEALSFRSFPDGKRVFYRVEAGILETGKWLDEGILEGASVMLNKVLKQPPIAQEDRPAKFVGSMVASLAQAVAHFVYVVARSVVHFILPFQNLDDPAYMLTVMSPKQASGVWLREFVNTGSLSVWWVLEYGHSRIVGDPAPTPRLDCSAEFVPTHYGEKYFQSIACAARSFGRALTTALAVASTVPVEIGSQAVLGGNRNFWTTLQRYDGQLRHTKAYANSCELRKASAFPGWDLTTSADMCVCTDEDELFSEVLKFDPSVWSSQTLDKDHMCGQPQIQDALREWSDGAERLGDVVVPFASPLVRAGLKAVGETVSTVVRFSVSLGDVLEGHFLTVPLIGPHYGAREDLAEKAWVERGGSTQSAKCPEGAILHAFEGDKTERCHDLDVVARMDSAFKRAYKGEPLCRGSNKAGCTCNPALEMLDDSACDCQLMYADMETTASDSYAETRWRMGSFRKNGWCGSQLTEGLWEILEKEAGSGVSSLVQALTPGSENLDFCGRQEYLILSTNTNWYTKPEFEDGMLTSRGIDAASLTEMKIRISERVKEIRRRRSASGLASFTTQQDARCLLDETLHEVTETQGPRAASNATNTCIKMYYGNVEAATVDIADITDAGKLVGISGCIVDETAKRNNALTEWDVAVSFDDDRPEWLYGGEGAADEKRRRVESATCNVRGHHNVLCSVSEAVEKGTEAYVGIARQAVNSGVAIITGHKDLVRFSLSARLCDAEKFWGAIASAATGMIDVRKDAQKAMAKFLFLLLDLQVQYGAQWDALFRLISRLINDVLFKTDGDLTKGFSFKRLAEASRKKFNQLPSKKPFKEFSKRLVSIYTKWLQLMLSSFGDIIEAYAKGGGAFFYELGNLVKGLDDGLSDMLLDTIMLLAGMVTDFMRVMSGEVGMLPSLMVKIFKVLPIMKKIFIRGAMKIVHVILSGMGPVGKFLSRLVGTLCTVFEGVLNAIVHAINFVSAGFAGLEEQDFGCIDSWVGADAGASRNATRKQRNFNDVPEIVWELGWEEGNTFCDNVIAGLKNEKWHTLSVLEQQTTMSCLQYRRIGAELARATGILDLERVAFDYVHLFHSVVHAMKAAYAHFDEMSPLRAAAFLDRVELEQYLPAIKNAMGHLSGTFTPETTAGIVRDSVLAVVEIVKESAPKGSDLERAFESSSKVAHKVYAEWGARNISQSIGRAWNSFDFVLPAHATKGASRTKIHFDRASHPVIANARRKLSTVFAGGKHIGKSLIKSYALGASLNPEDPCGSEYSLACTRCKILDNALVSFTEQSLKAAHFLKFYYGAVTLPSFARHIKARGFNLQNGATFAAENLFSTPVGGARVNAAEEFDRMTTTSGARDAQARMNKAKGSPVNLVAFGQLLTSGMANGSTTTTLDALRARSARYNLGSSLADEIAETLRRDREEPIEVVLRTRAERAAIDWEYLVLNFPLLPKNTSASYLTNTEQEEIETINLMQAVGLYLSTTSDEWVPLFQHGLFYSLSLPLLQKCDQDVVLYSSTTTQSERMERFDSAIITTGLIGLAVLALQWYAGLPVVALCAPATATLLWYLWLYFVYGYSWACVPSLPVHLANDVGAWVNRMFPEPLCARFPALALDGCDLQTSLNFNGSTAWASCFDNDAVRDLGYAYSFMWYFKTWFGDWYSYLRRVQPTTRFYLSDWPALDALDDPLDPAASDVFYENCARLLFMDMVGIVSLGAVGGWMAFTLVVPIITSLARSAVALSVQTGGILSLLLLSLSKVEK